MADECSVQVAVRVRPQIPRELIDRCRACTRVTPGEPQLSIGDRAFTYDHVFDTDTDQCHVYDTCVARLVDAALQGYNATVFAYGQTGSGKTYTMGTGFDVQLPLEQMGIIPRAIHAIFQGLEESVAEARAHGQNPTEYKVTAQFMEIYNEDIIDLFDPVKDYEAQKAMKIHEDINGDIHVVGVQQKAVFSVEEALQCLRVGALSRRTASTQMNSQSSRSHAIFSLLIRQKRLAPSTEFDEPGEFEILTSKFHFVDLAGSERLKRTGATGERAREGISINCGLLALGNVISALGTRGRRGQHIPYRDSKLTRLLQDSLGGNSKTLMIACISPSDRDFMETLNTLKYANRAKNIKNKVVINQDKSSRIIAMLRQEIAQLQMELLDYKQGKRVVSADGDEEVSEVHLANKMMESELNHLRNRIKAMQETINVITVKNTELLAKGVTNTWNNSEDNLTDVVQNYIKEIEELRAKLMESEFTCQNLRKQIAKLQANLSHNSSYAHAGSFLLEEDSTAALLEEAKYDLQKKMNILSRSSTKEERLSLSVSGEPAEDEDKDIVDLSTSDDDSDHEQELGTELAELSADIDMKQRLIEELEFSQKRIQTLKKNYENQLVQLQTRITDTQAERDRVLSSLHGHAAEPDKLHALKERYERRICELQSQLKQLHAAKKEHNKLLRDQSQHEQQLRTLRNDLNDMKRMKVKLINQMKEESSRHKDAEVRRMREIAQLHKESRKTAKMLRSLEAERKQKDQILKRKQEEVVALRRLQREQMARSAGSPAFSAKECKQKWVKLEKSINQVVLNKQVLAYQERDMNRLLARREWLTHALERARRRKAQCAAAEDCTELDLEIENNAEELSYVQDAITESQHSIVLLEEAKDGGESAGGELQGAVQTVHSLGEARYLLDKLLQMVLEQSFCAAQRTLLLEEREAELRQLRQEHQLVNQLLDYMVQKGEQEPPVSSGSSRAASPAVSLLDLDSSQHSSTSTRAKVRSRTPVSREVLLGVASHGDAS